MMEPKMFRISILKSFQTPSSMGQAVVILDPVTFEEIANMTTLAKSENSGQWLLNLKLTYL